MSIRWMNRIWQLPSDVTASERIVLLALADHADNDGLCWPGLDQVAEKCGLSRRHLIRLVKQLEQRGLLRAERNPGLRTSYVVLPRVNRGDRRGDMMSPPKRRISSRASRLKGVTPCHPSAVTPCHPSGVTSRHSRTPVCGDISSQKGVTSCAPPLQPPPGNPHENPPEGSLGAPWSCQRRGAVEPLVPAPVFTDLNSPAPGKKTTCKTGTHSKPVWTAQQTAALVEGLHKIFGDLLHAGGGRDQALWNRNGLNVLARHVAAGHAGDPSVAAQRVIVKAGEIVADHKVRTEQQRHGAKVKPFNRPAAVLVAWFKRQLQPGITWESLKCRDASC